VRTGTQPDAKTLVVFDAGPRGRGVRASRDIHEGSFIAEYAGERLTAAQAAEREAQYEAAGVDASYTYYVGAGRSAVCIDAMVETERNRISRLINHSRRSPNLKMHKIPGAKPGDVHIGLFAIRDIDAGEELTYDYGDNSAASVARCPWLNQS
jgi:histone-lysine N-methyltransferase SETD8